MPMQTNKLGFHIEPCSRCGGSGNFSRCEMHGTTCFKCSGKKLALTKAGAAAYAMYVASLSVPLGSLKVGDMMLCNSFDRPSAFKTVESIGALRKIGQSLIDGAMVDCFGIDVKCGPDGSGYGLVAAPNYIVRKGWTAAEKQPLLDAALAYQAELEAPKRQKRTA